MNRQQAKELFPIMQAFAEGKTIEYQNGYGEWIEATNPSFSEHGTECRIKSEPTYRPFKDKEECWQEMQKHQPFGWLKASHGQFLITGMKDSGVCFGVNDNFQSYKYMFENYTFTDSTPFGIKN